MRNLAGKVVVVTGASSGVGRAIACAVAAQGARVGLIARGIDGLEGAAADVRGAGGEPLVLPLDVADAAAVDAAAAAVAERWGAIDVWVNCAMVTVLAPVWDVRADEYRRVTEVTYLGFVHGTLAALKHMRPRNQGTIVQIGSALAYRSIPLQSAYCAAKAAIRGFTDSLRSELLHERSRIRVTMLQLPAIDTPQFSVMRNRMHGHPRPVAPVYEPEVIAGAVVDAICHPRREVWIGWSVVEAILGQHTIAGLLDRYLARRGWEGQLARMGHVHTVDNLDLPLPGDRGAHGEFDAEARHGSVELWLRRHWVSALFGVGLLLGLIPLRRGGGPTALLPGRRR